MGRVSSWAVAVVVLLAGIGAFADPAGAEAGRGGLAVEELRCEYRGDPSGVDVPRPRLTWVLKGDRRGARPTAYQVIVASRRDLLGAGSSDLWDSGVVKSEEAAGTEYLGRALGSGQECFWRVRAWDQEGRPSDWSPVGHWAMGLLRAEDWRARWIGMRGDDGQAGGPLPIVRREIEITKPVRRATAYVCGLGQFELRLNGERVGDDVLAPGWTNYRKSCPYVTYDLTGRLVRGKNAVGAMLGNGMFNVPRVAGRFSKFKGTFGAPVLIAQVEVEYEDGTREVVGTDSSWKVAAGPIVFSHAYGGEDFDARRDPAGWDRPGFDDSSWGRAEERRGPGGALAGLSAGGLPVRVERVLKAVKVSEPRPGVRVYDMGQNCALMPVVKVRGPAGATVRVTPAELTDAQGLAEQQWARRGLCYFDYTLKGEGEEAWGPRFTYYGSRYLQVETVNSPTGAGPVEVLDCAGRFVTAARSAGEFECSNETFNRTAQLIEWAIRSNTVSIFTDCPHREKLGWLEQTHLMGPSLAYGFDVPAQLEKMCRDMAEAQTDDGLVPDIAPEYTVFKGAFRDSPEWGSAAVMVPWQVYRWYGDERSLRERYGMMKRYVEYLGTTAKDGIVSHGLGDWYDLGPKPPGLSQLTPVPLTATAFYYADLCVLERAARVLGKTEEAAGYAGRADRVKDAFNRAFFDPTKRSYAAGSQCANAMPVVFGLVPEGDVPAVVDNIVADVRGHDNGLTAGDVGYRFLLRALADHGRSDVVYDMNSRSDRPGYGYMIAKGATSLTEAWDARGGSSSQDHFMLGHILEWFYGDVAGIRQAEGSVGWRRVSFRPSVVGDLTWARATYRSVRGEISCAWKRDGERVTVDVSLPPGVTGTVWVPGQDGGREVASGSYSFEGRFARK